MSIQKDTDCEMTKTGKLFFQEMSSLKKIVFETEENKKTY